MTTASVSDFVAVVRESQLLDAAQLQEIERDCSTSSDLKALTQRLVQRSWLTPYQAEQLLHGNASSLVLGPYRLLDLLGEGGMGQVFKALHTRLQRTVALKVIHPGRLADDPEAVKRFQREARAAALMVHPNVVMVYDADQVGDTSYIALEYVEGVDLGKLVKEKGRLPVAQACDYIRQAALGLQHAFEHGVVHRDIKPSNLLVTHRPDPRKGITALHARAGSSVAVPVPQPRSAANTLAVIKILDMGLVRIVQGDGNTQMSLTQEGTVMGTPDYIAPEQARNAHRVDIRADLYSLGCTLYHLLAGQPPFPEGTVIEKLLMHQLDTPQPLEQLRPDVPPGVVAVVNKLMAKRREDRCQTPAEAAEALARFAVESTPVFSRPIVAPRKPAAPPAPVRRPIPQDQTPPPRGDLSLCGKTAKVTIAFPTTSGDTPAPTERPTPEFLVSFSGHDGGVQAAAFSRDRDTLATGGLDGTVRVWDFGGPKPRERAILKAARPSTTTTSRPRTLPGLGAPSLSCAAGQAVHSVAVAPNNRWLASGGGGTDGLIRLWDLSADVPVEKAVLPGHKSPVDALAFAPDGKLLASGGNDRTIRLWDLATAPPRERGLLRGHGDVIKALTFSPDGKLLASAGQDSTIRLWHTHSRLWGREQAVLPGHGGHVTTLGFSPDGRLLASGSQDQSVCLWDVTQPKPEARAVLAGHTSMVRSVLFAPGGQILISVDDGGQVIQWDVSSAQKVRGWILPRTLLCSVALTIDGRYLATGTSDGKVRIYRLGTKRRNHNSAPASGVA